MNRQTRCTTFPANFLPRVHTKRVQRLFQISLPHPVCMHIAHAQCTWYHIHYTIHTSQASLSRSNIGLRSSNIDSDLSRHEPRHDLRCLMNTSIGMSSLRVQHRLCGGSWRPILMPHTFQSQGHLSKDASWDGRGVTFIHRPVPISGTRG